MNVKILPGKSHFVIELPPCRRTIMVRGLNSYFLSFPKIVFLVRYKYAWLDFAAVANENYVTINVYCYFVTKDDILCLPPLDNIDANSYVCFGKNIIAADSIAELADKVYNTFWQSEFKLGELGGAKYTYDTVLKPSLPLHCYEHWEQITKSNPQWIPDKDDLIPLKDSFIPLKNEPDPFFSLDSVYRLQIPKSPMECLANFV